MTTRRPRSAAIAVAAAVAAMLVGAAPAHAASASPTATTPPAVPPAVADSPTKPTGVSKEMVEATGQVTAFVSLTTKSGTEVAAEGGSKAAVQQAKQATEVAASSVVSAQVTAANALSAMPKRLGTTTNLVSGTLVTGDAAAIRALASNPLVDGIYRITPKTVDNAATVTFTRTLATWENTGLTGKGETIGIIDTGLDYTHADFGGKGTAEAYAAAYGTDGTGPIPAGSYDPAKFAGGYDFAGHTYDAASTDPSRLVPVPDENPIDTSEAVGGSHGTHVAGSAAGYGLTAAGTTFTGDYSKLTDVSTFKIGPGAAPQAKIYSLKVFGDEGGSTNLTMLALDKAADPNGDGDFNDHLNVVNLSLGGDFAPSDDPDSIAVDRLSALGTVVVVAAGNAGDQEDVAGSPGNAASALTVANSASDDIALDAVKVTAASKTTLVGTLQAAQNSTAYPASSPDATAPVAYLGSSFTGCTAYTTDQAARVAGKIVWLYWDNDDTTRPCGSAARANAAAKAGAVGAVFTSQTPLFNAGILGNAAIPVAQLTAASTTTLQGEAAAGTLSLQIGPSLAGLGRGTTTPDVLNESSSRGTHGSVGAAKPDVAAPGTNIVSAAATTGTGSANYTGTSMATPHVAGIAALVAQAHPGWTSSQLKAAIVDTATHDVYTGANRSGLVYGPARVGSGRVDALAATTTSLLAYNTDDPKETSITFGVVPVGATTVTVRKTVTIANLGGTQQVVRPSFTTSTTAGAASVTVSPASVTVPAGQTRLVTLTLTADPATLSRDLDPTSSATMGGDDREYISRLTGRLVLATTGGQLRVPVQAVPVPTSQLTSSAVTFASPAATTATLAVSGRTLNPAKNWYSFATPLLLGATSPRLDALTPGQAAATSPSVVASGDIRDVGWSSTAPAEVAAGGNASDGTLNIGIAVDSNWASLGAAMNPIIDIDVNGDGTPDYETQVSKVTNEDVTLAWTYDLSTGDLVTAYYANEFTGAVDNGVYDGSTVVAPIPLSIIPAGAKPTVTAWTESSYAPSGDGVVDKAPSFQVDPYDPPLWFGSNVGDRATSLVTGDTSITVHRGTGADKARLMVLYPDNPDPASRVQLVDVTAPVATPTTTTLAVTGTLVAGKAQTLTATVAPATATGTVTFLDGATSLGSATVSGGTAALSVKLGGGAHTLTASFAPATVDYAASTSAAVPLTVAASTSTTSLKVSTAQTTFGSPVTATVTVTGASASPAGGTVTVLDGSTAIGSATLSGSGTALSASVALPTALAVGSHTLTASFAGTADVAASTSKATTVKVAKAVPKVTGVVLPLPVPRGTAPTATVWVGGPTGAPWPTGTVTVYLGFQKVGTAPVVNGVATLTLPVMRTGQIAIAVYSGDGSYWPNGTGGWVPVR